MHLKNSIDYQPIICAVRCNERSAGNGGCKEGLRPLDYGLDGCFCFDSGLPIFFTFCGPFGSFRSCH